MNDMIDFNNVVFMFKVNNNSSSRETKIIVGGIDNMSM